MKDLVPLGLCHSLSYPDPRSVASVLPFLLFNCHAKQMLKIAPQGKHGRHPTIISRWYADEEYRKSLSAIGWREHHITLYDRIAVEKHIDIATRSGRILNSKHWILTKNAEGPQFPLNQRPDFAQAKRECKRLDPTKIQDHSSQSTNKTAKRTTN